MRNDATTLQDLSFFDTGQRNLFQLLDYTTTAIGRERLRKLIKQPPDDFQTLSGLQQAIRFYSETPDAWTKKITNGTIVMLEKYFESAQGAMAKPGGLNLGLNRLFRRFFHHDEYSFIRFSLSHLSDFLRGCAELIQWLHRKDLPPALAHILKQIEEEMRLGLVQSVMSLEKTGSYKNLVRLDYFARRELKLPITRLMQHYARLDCWNALGLATRHNGWVFPQLRSSFPVCLEAQGLYHPLLERPVSYDVSFRDKNLLILTGANMSGKTTFLRAIGASAILAHIGAGVPARNFQMSFLEGIITNMHVEDNLISGESYFFAEVMRMKKTAERISEPKPHLVLMDELFKGTNVHDAYECTQAVVEGLLRHPHHLMALSTHLYEVARTFSPRDNIWFAYFSTDIEDDGDYHFRYELKEGISSDRIGYRMLQKEGVLEILNG